MLNTGVLVLNRAFFPVHITSVRRAFCLLYTGLARAINSQYEMYDFQSWSELSVHTSEEAIGLVGRMIRVPRVVVLTAYDRVPRRNVRFCRRNIFGRDRNTCQYCGKMFPTTELNLDHSPRVPRAFALPFHPELQAKLATAGTKLRKNMPQLGERTDAPFEAGPTTLGHRDRTVNLDFFDMMRRGG